MKLMILSLVFVALSACSGSSDESGISTQDVSLSYSFSECFNNNCCEVSHEYDNREDYCDRILDEAFNNFCARESREEAYDDNCL